MYIFIMNQGILLKASESECIFYKPTASFSAIEHLDQENS